jgi:hypothetical protein
VQQRVLGVVSQLVQSVSESVHKLGRVVCHFSVQFSDEREDERRGESID